MQQRELRDEDFDLASGLMDDFDAEVTDAWFAPPRQEYIDRSGGDTTPFLNLKLESPDLDQPIEQVWSTGSAKNWQVQRNGREIVSSKSPDLHQFASASRAGGLVDRIITLAGEGDRAKGVQIVRSKGYLMTEAEFYIGLSCHWEREQMPTVSGETRDVLMPTALLGIGDSDVAGSVTAPSAPAFGDEEIAALVTLASGKTEQQLKQQVMRSELKGNKDLLNAIFNKGLLTAMETEGTLVKSPDGKYI